MIVLGLDPSLTDSGWCVVDYSKPFGDQVIAMGRIRTKAKDFFTRRYRKHYEGVRDLIDLYKPDYVGIEQPPPQASWSAGLYPLWISMADSCTESRIPFATWMPTSVKAFAKEILQDPKGKLFKSDMVDASKISFGITSQINHNIADALLINQLSYRFRSLMLGHLSEDDLTVKERYMFTRTKVSKKTKVVEKLGMMFKEGKFYYDLHNPKYDYLYE